MAYGRTRALSARISSLCVRCLAATLLQTLILPSPPIISMSFPPVFKQPPTTSIVDDTTKPRTVTMPQSPTPTNDVSIDVDVPLGASALINEELLPPTPSLRVSPALPGVSDNMGDIWRSINNRNISETEKMMNEINYTASASNNLWFLVKCP